MKHNSMYFDQGQEENLLELVHFLMKQAYDKNGSLYNDIHIKPEDCGAFSVEWSQVDWECPAEFGKFQFVDSDEVVAKDTEMPDGKFVLCRDDEETQEIFDAWLKEHPNWKKNQYGHWYNTDEYRGLEQELGKRD